MNKFRSYLSENSFYSIQKEKDEFIGNDKLIMNAFFFAFIMPLGFLDASKDKDRTKRYFKSDGKVRLDNIDDTNNDSSLIIKIMNDKGFFKTQKTANEITRFLFKTKTGQIDEINSDILRGWINQIKPDKMKGSSAVVKKLTQQFLDGGSLGSFADGLKANAKVTRWKNNEFFDIAKVSKIDPAKKKAATPPAATAGDDTPTPTQASPADSTPSVDTKPASTKKTDGAKGKQNWPGAENVWLDIDANNFSADDIDNEYKHTAAQRKDFLTYMIMKIMKSESIRASDVKPVIDFVKKYKIDQNQLQKDVFGYLEPVSSWTFSRNVREKTERIKKMVEYGFFGLIDKTSGSKSVVRVVQRTFDFIIEEFLASDSEPEMKRVKENYKEFLESPLFLNNHELDSPYNIRQRLAGLYLTKDNKEFLSSLEKERGFDKKPDGTYSFDFQQIASYPAFIILLKELGITQKSQIERVIDVIRSSGSFPWGSLVTLTRDEEKEIYEYFDRIKGSDDYDRIATKGIRFSATDLVKESTWQKELLTHFIENISESQLLFNVFNGAFDDIVPNRVLKSHISSFVDRLAETYKNKDLLANNIKHRPSYQAIDKFFAFTEATGKTQQYQDLLGKKFIEGLTSYIRVKSSPTGYFYINSDINRSPRSTNEVKNVLSKKDQDRIDAIIIDSTFDRDKLLEGPCSLFTDLNTENRKKVIDFFRKDPLRAMILFRPIVDKELYNQFSPSEMLEIFGDPLKIHKNIFSLPNDDVKSIINKALEDPKALESLDAEFETNISERGTRDVGGAFQFSKFVNTLIESENVDEQRMSRYIDITVNAIKNNKYMDVEYYVSTANSSETFNKKSKIFLEKLISSVDTDMNKMKKGYREFMTYAQPQFMKYIEFDKEAAEAFYVNTSKSLKRRLAGAYLEQQEFSTSAQSALTDESSPIKPFEKLTPKRIKEILKYNNVVSEETKIADKHIKDFASMDLYVENEGKNVKPIEDLKIEEIEMSRKELGALTAQLHRTKRSGRHGEIGMVIKKSFNVAIPLQVEAQKEWIAKDPEQEIINPMYHGTGSIAASMILRYGFRVIKSGDSSVVGRMLGDGVYGAIHIDKSQQYIGDAGYARTVGTRGYIFEMNAALGEPNKDYRAAGLGNRDGIRSPEWCVFTPNSQFRIFKAHEVEIIKPSTMATILAENPADDAPVTESRSLKFKKFLKEYSLEEQDDMENYTTYTFVNGLIPTGIGEYVDFEEFKSPDPKMIALEPSAYGPTVVIKGTRESGSYTFTGPTAMRVEAPEIYDEYIKYLNRV